MSILDKDAAMEDHWTYNPAIEDFLYNRMKTALDQFNEAHLKETKEQRMTKEEALKIIKLLSAMESWAFSTKTTLPDYLHEDLCLAVEKLEKIVLEKT